MATYEAGTAFLQIVPSFQGVVEKISDQAAQWGKTAGKAFQDTFEEATKGLNIGPSDSESSKQGASSGGAFADGFRAKVEAALKALPSADVELNDAEAEAKLDDLRTRLETLRNVEIGVDLTDAEALSAVEIIKGELDELGAKSPNIRVQVDAGEASAELAAISAQADAAGAGEEEAGSDAAGASAGIGTLVAALALLATALIPIGGLAAGALSALPAIFAGAASGIGALKLGFSGISGALSAYTSQQNAAGGAAKSSGQSAASAAEQALSAAQQTQSAAQAVASAQETLANAQTSAADEVHRAQEQLAQSEQALADAEQNELNAQKALTQARIDAANAITNLNDQVADGALAIQQATLDQATAQAALTAAQDTPGTSASVLAQAQLTAAQAAQHLQDLTDQQQQLTQAQQAATAAGVDGSTQVISATQALGQAQQTVGNDQQAQTDAQTALTEAQATAVQKVTDAQTALSQALQNQSETLERITLEQQAAGASGASAAGGTNSFAKAMAGLTPAGRAFVDFITQTLMPMYDAFKAQVQSALLPGITTALIALLPVFQVIEPFIIQAALGISSFAQGLAGLLSSGPDLFNLSVIFQAGAGFMQDLANAALSLVPAFLTIGAQAAPVVAALGKGIEDLVKSFANWVANGGFERFLNWLKTNGPTIVSDLAKFLTGFGKLVVALAPVGGVVLTVLGYLGQFLGYLVKTPAALTGVSIGIGILAAALLVLLDSNPVGLIITAIFGLIVGITELVTHWSQVWSEIKEVFDAAVSFLRSGFGTLVILLTGPFAPLLLLALHWQQVWAGMQQVASSVYDWLYSNIFGPITDFFTNTLPNALDTVGSAFATAWSGIQGAVSGAWSWLVSNVFNPMGTFFTQTIPSWIGTLVGFFTGIPGAISSVLGGIFGAITGAFSSVNSWISTNVIGPLVGFFVALPGNIASAMSAGAQAAGSALSSIGKDVVNGIIGALNHIIDTIDSALAGVSAFGFHPFGAKTIPDIPTLHTGGIVPGTPGTDVPAILQAGELVVSRNDVGNLTAAAGGTNRPQSIYSPTFEVQAFDPVSAAITMQQKADFAAKTRGF